MESSCATLDWRGLDELRPVLRQSLARRCADEHELEDVIQETLLRAARYRVGLQDPERLTQWVVRIARNVCRDRRENEWRRRRRPKEELFFQGLEGSDHGLDEEPADGGFIRIRGEEVEQETALRLLGQALGELPDRDAVLLHSHYQAGRSCRDTAALCEMPEGLVKVRLFRARRRLGRTVERLVVRARLARLENLEVVA